MKYACTILLLIAGCEYRKVDRNAEAGAASTATVTAPVVAADASAPRKIGGDRARPRGVAIDADSVYWTTNWDLIGVRRLPRNGTPETTPVTVCKFPDRFMSAENLIVTDSHVFFLAWRAGGGGLYRVARTAVDAPCDKLVDLDVSSTRALAKHGNRIYAAGAERGTQGSLVVEVDEQSATRTLGSVPSAIDGLASDGAALYLAGAWLPSTLYKIELGPGHGPLSIGRAGGALQLQADKLYFIANSDKRISTLPLEGGQEGKRLTDDGSRAFLIVGDTLYNVMAYSGRSPGFSLKRGPLATGKLADFGSGYSDSFQGIAGDSRDVYVATSGELIRLAP